MNQQHFRVESSCFMCGYTQGVGVGHHNFWSIVLDNIWSKYMISRPTMIHWTPVLHSSIDDLVFLWFERKIHESEQRETAWQSLVLFRRKCQYLFFSVRIHNKNFLSVLFLNYTVGWGEPDWVSMLFLFFHSEWSPLHYILTA